MLVHWLPDKKSVITRVDRVAANHPQTGLTKTPDLSYDQTFQLLWTTCCAHHYSYIYALFSGTVMVVPAFLDVHTLILVVYVCIGAWVCVLHVCDMWWSQFCNSAFNIGTVRVLPCNEALGTSSLLAVEGEVVQVR